MGSEAQASIMKLFLLVSAVLTLSLVQASIIRKNNPIQKIIRDTQDDCEGTMCPGGCCPEVNWQCCPDNLYCAATLDDCPTLHKKNALIKMAAKKDDCEGTMCPGGCCPEVNWQCCPDNLYCAATLDDCPTQIIKNYIQKLAAKKFSFHKLNEEKDCNGTLCPGGCCPESDWICCKDERYCAQFEEDCPKFKLFI